MNVPRPLPLARLLLSPTAFIVAVFWASYLIWLLTPDSFLAAYGMTLKASASTGALLCTAATGASLLGIFMVRFLPLAPADASVPSTDFIARYCLLLLALAILGQGIVLGAMVLTGGVHAITDSIAGLNRAFKVPGLTTLVHVGSAVPALSFAVLRVTPRESMTRNVRRVLFFECITALGFCAARAYLMGERVALMLPFMSVLIIHLLTLQRRFLFTIGAAALGGVVALFGIFTGSEMLRSFDAKNAESGYQLNAVQYSSERLLLYYSTSINTAIAEYTFRRATGETHRPIFSTTLAPLRQMIDAVEAMAKVAPIKDDTDSLLMAEHSKLAEFTNVWGVAIPFTESRWLGFVYWLSWGAILGRMFVYIRRGSASVVHLAFYGVGTAGLIDTSRVLLLGQVHTIIPLLVLAPLFWVHPRDEGDYRY